MPTPEPGADLNDLIAASAMSERAQADKAQATISAAPRASRAKALWAAALGVACIGLGVLQYPRIHNPFHTPDPTQDAVAAQTDLGLLAQRIDTFRAEQGRLPEGLGPLELPGEFTALLAAHPLVYRTTATGYQLEWTLPHSRMLYDSATGTASNTPVR